MLRQRTARGWLLGLAMCLAGWTPLAAAPQADPAAKTGDATTQEMYVAIVGEIRQPGTYRIVGKSVTLQDLVKRAGGTTPAASTLVCRIRCGEPGPRFPFRADAQDPLLDGDVYQVEREPNLPAGRNKHGIHVALVGVLQRPVVQEIPPGQNETLTLIRQLGLTEEAARQVRVVDHSTRWDPGQGAVEELPIDNGAVVILQPQLQAALKLERRTLASAIEFRRNQPPPLAAVPPEQCEPVESSQVAAQNETELPPSPALPPLPVPLESPSDDEGVVRADLQAPGAAPALSEIPPAAVSGPKGEPLKALDPLEDLAEAFGEDELQSSDEASSPIGLWHMFGILGIVAGLVGMALFVRRLVGAGTQENSFDGDRFRPISTPESTPEAAESPAAAAQSTVADVVKSAVASMAATPVVHERDELATRLQRLLDDAVPVREERIELPAGRRLDGWLSAAAVAHRHTEHPAIPRPHLFAGRTRGERRAGRVEEFLEEAARPAASNRETEREAMVDDPAGARAKILERLKLTTDLKTPLDRALQRLQGGGR